MMAELFGKITGYCKGKGGSLHIADLNAGNLGANGIVGGGIPIATGSGLTGKYKKTGKVTVCFFGDGASNTGAFHEAVNMAATWKLPVVYVCENNLYAMSTPVREAFPILDIAERGQAYGMPGIVAVSYTHLDVYKRQENPIPINILLCENLKDAPQFFKNEVKTHLNTEGKQFLQEKVGFVGTVVARMVPVMDKRFGVDDPLFIVAEAYNRCV